MGSIAAAVDEVHADDSRRAAFVRDPAGVVSAGPAAAILLCALACAVGGCSEEEESVGDVQSALPTEDSPPSGRGDAPADDPDLPPQKSEGGADGAGDAAGDDARADAAEAAAASDDPAAAPAPDGPRVYAKARFTWIRSAPNTDNQWIGYLWTGGSVPLREGSPVPGQGCKKSWYPIEPRGWVCVDDRRATLDPDDPVVRAVAPYRAKLDLPWPHRYAAVPRTIRRHALLPGPGPQPFPELPRGLQEGRLQMRDRSTLAYVDEVQRGDRTFLLAADMSWVDKSVVELYDQVEFQGLRLEGDVQLPLAFFKGEDRPGYRPTEDGTFVRTETMFPRLSWVKLTGESRKDGRETYYETVRDGLWVRRGGAVVPTPRKETPWGAPVGEPDETGQAPRGRGTWLEVSVLEGWLVAFEGTRPVYVTLTSSGRGGTPHGDRDPVETASTPTGTFGINGKFATATMESPVKIVHSDVPWTQNFSGPHALHGAYWHDNWGSVMSAGCINLSPRDARWLYEFTEPPVPPGWHAVRHVPRYGAQTRLIVHE